MCHRRPSPSLLWPYAWSQPRISSGRLLAPALRLVSRPIPLIGSLLFLGFFPIHLSPAPAQAASPNPEYLDALWIAKNDRILKLAAADGAPLLEVASIRKVAAAAVDERRGVVWTYGDGTLRGYSFNGAPLFVVSIDLEKPGEESGGRGHAALAVNSTTGTAWLGIRRRLFQFNLQGRLARTYSLPENVQNLVADPVTSLIWVATKETLNALGDNGNLAVAVNLEKNPDLQDIDVDSKSGQLWVALKKTLRRYNVNGALQFETRFDNSERIAAAGTGGLWVATNKELVRVTQTGELVSKFPLLDDKDGKLVDLVAHTRNLSVWVATELALSHINAVGQVLYRLEFKGPVIEDLTLYQDTIPPVIRFTAPANGAFINTKTPNFRLSYSDVGSGVNPATLGLRAEEPVRQELPVTCAYLESTTVCVPLSPLPEGRASLLASVKDWNANLSEAASLAFTVDTLPPRITLQSPSIDTLTHQPQQVLLGAVNEPTRSLTLNNQIIPIAVDGTFQHGPIVFPEGITVFNLVAEDLAGNVGSLIVRITVDTIPPAISLAVPRDGSLTNQPQQTFRGQLSEAASLILNGQAVSVATDLGFQHSLLVSAEGLNVFNLIATDRAGNTGSLAVRITLDTVAPTAPNPAIIQLGPIINGQVNIIGKPASVEGGSTVVITNLRSGQSINTAAGADGSFTTVIAAQEGDKLELVAKDRAGNSSPAIALQVGVTLPPDPTTVAPPLDRSVATTVQMASQFLYTASNPIQTGVAAGTIQAKRAAVLRGRATDRNDAPLAGVRISALGHPEFGQTLTRADGMFDLAVNGGGPLALVYQKSGFLPAQRQVAVPWQDYVFLPDVTLVEQDGKVTTVDLSSSIPIQVARGNPVSDADGTRQATLLFSQGTQADLLLPNGSTQAITNLSVRATEYTAGDKGPRAMPAALPPTSAYTYAVEFSVDQADALAATDVRFSKPVWFYLENFLKFPVGGIVPAGYYDRVKATWVPSDNGRVIKILDVGGGLASLDVDGSGAPASAQALANLGITDPERRQLADLYPAAGITLWRAPIDHFTPWDFNWPYVLPGDARPPGQAEARKDSKIDSPCRATGSVVECQNQVLGEAIGIVGTSLNLHYQSDRVTGRKAANLIEIPLSAATVPASLKRMDLVIEIAGRQFSHSVAAGPNQTFPFTWDGKDGYGRTLQGNQPITLRIGYVYGAVYAQPAQLSRSFGAFSAIPISTTRTRQEITLWQEQNTAIGPWDALAQGLGAWSLSEHHAYDAIGKVLYLGNGQRRSTENLYSVVSTLIAGLSSPAAVAAAADGSLYFADGNRVQRVAPDGIITVVAGTGAYGYAGDGGLATLAQLASPRGLAFGPDGSLYIADTSNNRIRRVGLDGIITTVAGSGTAGFGGDGGLATQAKLSAPAGIAVGPDGSIYVADSNNDRIRRVAPDGTITTVAGNGFRGFAGDRGKATAASIGFPQDVALAADGSFYIADWTNLRIRRVSADGIITTVAGTGGTDVSGDGGPAIEAALGFPSGIEMASDGSLYISLASNDRIRRLTSAGIITTVAGSGTRGTAGDGGPATQAALLAPVDVATGPEGNLYIAQTGRVRKVTSPLPGLSIADIVIPSEDASEIYVFDDAGRHLRTLNAFTGVPLLQFRYDAQGRLIQIQDGDGNTTTVERDTTGNPTAIVAPFGQRTQLTLDAKGYLARIANPAGESASFAYTSDGLMTSLTDPKGSLYQFNYDPSGRLVKDQDPADGFHALARSEIAGGWEVAKTTALNRVTRYRVERAATGGRHLLTTFADGTKTDVTVGTDQRRLTTLPDGTTSNLLEGPDPRFGMQAPFSANHTLKTPSGILSTITGQRTATLSDPNNVLSLTKLTDQVTINGRAFTRIFDAATRKFTATTPEGRQTFSMVDALGRVLQHQVTGLAPANFAYDARGRLTTATVGTASDTRATTFAYNSSSYLDSVTDALGRVTRFDYDSAGRVTRQTLADGRTINFSYDINGNVMSVIPPSRPSHNFSYTPLDLPSKYTPPSVGGSSQTSVDYNADRQPARITRPDTLTLDFGYDSAGRLSNLSLPAGQLGYTFSAATGNLTGITAPSGGTLSYSYDGSLLTSEAWAGEIVGMASRTFDNNLRVTSHSVNGGQTVTYQYDRDDLLTKAGDLTLNRDLQNGLITATALGNVMDSWSYSGFSEATSYSASHGGTPLYLAQYTRDKLGRITTKNETVSGAATTYGYTYDPAGRLAAVTRNGVALSTYTYDSNGNRLTYAAGGASAAPLSMSEPRPLERAKESEPRPSGSGPYEDSRPSGGEESEPRPSGSGGVNLIAAGAAADVYRGIRDSVSEPLHSGTGGGGVTTGSSGNVERFTTEPRPSGSGPTDESPLAYARGSEFFHSSSGSAAPASPDIARSFTTTGAIGGGDITATTGATITATYDAQDRLIQYGPTTYNYTANGELLSKTTGSQTTLYQYDVLGNLLNVRLPDGSRVDYMIDGANRRIGKKVNGLLVQGFLYQNGLNPIAELNGNNAVKARFVYASRSNVPDYMMKAGVNYRIISDHLGSPRIVIQAATGEIVQRLDYDEFGSVLMDTNPGFQPFGFAGGLYDRHTGLIRFGARDYDPETGRWTAKDPIGFGGGDTNLYGYVLGDPINSLDIVGLWNRDLHEGVPGQTYGTYTRAQLLGFSDAAARAIGAANIGVDSFFGTTSPYPTPWNFGRSRHFDIPLGGADSRDAWAALEMLNALEAWKRGDCYGAYRALGRGLHSIQDKYSHGNWDNEHHPFRYHGSELDDWSGRDAATRRAVERATDDYLQQFLNATSLGVLWLSSP
ncbi:MAG: SMP-30/gluconolactonase/LRE family protein [Acidobacteria bacterium]|nr:SMP-30/gluconolactonase/LRE family protein [Acidobacteriota bacterium]